MDLLIAYWPVALVAALAVTLLLYLLLRPRQRVTLTDSAPLRPHMAVDKKVNGALSEPHGSAVPSPQPGSSPGGLASADDLTRLKGVGPKLAALLIGQGLVRFDQLAALSPEQVTTIDETLGVFRGRLTRDNVVDQAAYLARRDIDGFERKYGKL